MAALAAEQYGAVSATELLELGLTRTAIAVRVRCGRLHRVHRGVYAVGHDALSLEGRFMAATLACGPRSWLGYRACSAHWEFRAWEDDRLVEVVVEGCAGRSRPGLHIHRTRRIDSRDVMRHRGIRVTTPARTLLDLADVLPDKGLRRAVRQAQALHLTNVRQIADVLTRAQGRRGAQRLAALIADGPTPTRSELEDLVLGVVLDGGLQRPPINRRRGRVYPDLRWPEQRLTVECDSATWHSGKLAQEDDAERQARLEADGERVLRVTWEQALKNPEQTIARIAAAGAPRGPGRRAPTGHVARPQRDDGRRMSRMRRVIKRDDELIEISGWTDDDAGVLYASYVLEELALIELVERLNELNQNKMLSIGAGQASNLLHEFWDQGYKRMPAPRRTAVYESLFGAPFDDLLKTLAAARADGAASDDVAAAAVALREHLDAHADETTAKAAAEMRGVLGDIGAVLSDIELRSAYGADGMWQLIENIQREFGGDTDVQAVRTRAVDGAMLVHSLPELCEGAPVSR